MIKRYRRTAVSQYVIVGLILIALILLGFLSTLVMRRFTFVDHFALPWAAGRAWLLEGENPYDPSLVQNAERAIAGSGYLAQLPKQQILIHPLINLFYFLPFSFIPYSISRAVWVVCLMASAGLIVHFSLKLSEWKLSTSERIGVKFLLIFWFPGIFAMLTGRLTLILILLMLLGVISLKSGNTQTAGFLLALTSASLPVTILMIFLALLWSVAKKNWSFILAYFSGFAFLLVISLLMLPSWPLDWMRILLANYQDFTWIQTPLMTLASILPGIFDFLSIALHAGFGIYLLVIWINMFRESDRVLLWSALTVFVMAFLYLIQYSLSALYLVVPALCLVFRFASDRWRLVGKIGAWLMLVLISGGSWLLILPEIRFLETVTLPVLEVGLPLFSLLAMIWIRWWAVKLTRLPKF